MTVHQGLVQLLTLLHEVLVPLLHVALRDGFWNTTKQIQSATEPRRPDSLLQNKSHISEIASTIAIFAGVSTEWSEDLQS